MIYCTSDMEILLNNLGISLSDQGILSIFFKLFALVFSLLYLLYAIVLYRQIIIMNKTITTQASPIFQFIGLIQLIVAVALFILAVFLI